MSYLDKIRRCNEYDKSQFLPFFIDGQVRGLTHKQHLPPLLDFPEVFIEVDQGLTLHPSLNSCDSRSAAVAPAMRSLFEQGVIDSWVNEQYSISKTFGDEPELLIERAAVAFLGLPSYGVHMNGLVRDDSGNIQVWIGKRSREKPFWPGMLDQMVAGGQPVGISPFENLLKEAEEEAGIPTDMSRQAERHGTLRYCNTTHRGLHNDGIFVYDLWLDNSFIPQNTDGEVESFQLISINELAELTEHSDEFKGNCNLVNIDLLLRLGHITGRHPDYQMIRKELYEQSIELAYQ